MAARPYRQEIHGRLPYATDAGFFTITTASNGNLITLAQV
jgi:hypothetical protein